jgi:hypothetical protein
MLQPLYPQGKTLGTRWTVGWVDPEPVWTLYLLPITYDLLSTDSAYVKFTLHNLKVLHPCHVYNFLPVNIIS